MTSRRTFCQLLATSPLLLSLSGGVAVAAQDGPIRPPEDVVRTDQIELHRLRIVNRVDGAIQVSSDGGTTWRLIGRVVIPASTVVEGYIAADYATPGTVAAISVHGIRIRTSPPNASLHAPLILSIDPKEYANQPVNKGYGGHRPGSAGIFTDIPAGTSLFRELSPLVGNRVLLEGGTGRTTALPPTFRPTGQGEIFIIPVTLPTRNLRQVIFENRKGGAVRVTYNDGKEEEVTKVVRPVKGVGRFDGTAYTGVGRLNTAHTGVITVSTAPIDGALPEGVGKERRGGFQISPAWHNGRTEEAGAPIVMTLGSEGARKREWEGMPPLFRDLLPLGNAVDAESAIVDVSIDGGAWEPLPALIGLHLDAFTGTGLTRYFKAVGKPRKVKDGITAFRLRVPELSSAKSAAMVTLTADWYQKTRYAAAQAGQVPIVQGLLTINAAPTNAKNVSFVRLIVEGAPRGFTNVAPFALTWDTRRVPDGEYLLEAEALDSAGGIIAGTRRRVYVLNNTPPAPVKVSTGG